jgi:DNA-binding beta-propeller fold protein YncE
VPVIARMSEPILAAVLLSLLPGGVALALQVTGLKNPAGFIVDPATGSYFISNENGQPTERDNNGFITKLDPDGKINKLKFIEGGVNGVTLHAPKALATIGRTLYVSDIDRVRRFDADTGRPLGELDLSSVPVDFLTGLATDGHGTLYIADAGADAILRVDTRRSSKPTVLVKDPALAGPYGLAVNPATGALVVVSWNTGKILEVTDAGTVKVLFPNSFFSTRFGNLTGVDFDASGNMYVSDFSEGRVVRIDPNFRFQTIAEFLTTPASLGIDRKNHLILVPYRSGNVAEMNGLGRERKR